MGNKESENISIDHLSPEAYRVTQEKGTEAPFSGVYYDHHEEGMYRCVVCKSPLFPSDAKFESGSGWPSFFKTHAPDTVILSEDTSHGMVRTEVTCATCGAHLGHLFHDGPEDKGGMRYCINSCALDFEKQDE
jgi:peptide-methionine (R)-S-oxide reductase